ncbi:sushi, von Willebrand factor type A, EGF and pentraxin domain-containing protein 1-like [Patella vulgata]|uniref:sushi, von Willebrand factor type A, EGF and pentraxin domain-containing protein 1-like n=1 Tax=Patella vulgata TaxID=6465 RepID=UPI0024A84D17|nr:sushi, von Willebrand factor type A, EGF and pentraxin domain-containing protein 1-like [Patella vulgata]
MVKLCTYLFTCGYTNLENGVISPSGQHYKDDRLTLVCNQGYQISGSTPAFLCGESPPTCINIDECRSGTANCVSSTCTDTIGSFTCTCNPGYTLSSFSRTSCNDINECSVNNGGCDQICSNTQGSYTCSCYSNYVLFTTNGQNGVNIPSGETGLESWNVYHYGHTCLAIQCPSLPQYIVNGRSVANKTRFNVGDTVTYVCNVGYVTQGAAILTCGSTGSWNGQPPTCSAVTCSPPGIPPTSNGLTISPQSSINYNDYFTLTCTLPNNQIRTERRACVYNQATRDYEVLSGSLECPVIDCGVPTRFSGTLPYYYTCTTYGCSFIFNCRTPWFQLAGSSSANSGTTVRCGVDGHWDYGNLRCPGPTCSDPGTPPGGLQVSSSYEEYSLVSYTCSRYGYGPSQTNSLMCYWDSTRNALQWNSTMPRCIDKLVPTFTDCPVNDVIVSKMSTAGIPTPRATDNSNMIASLEITPPTFSVDHVVKADQYVTYRATDHAGNQATCSFDIRIKAVDQFD